MKTFLFSSAVFLIWTMCTSRVCFMNGVNELSWSTSRLRYLPEEIFLDFVELTTNSWLCLHCKYYKKLPKLMWETYFRRGDVASVEIRKSIKQLILTARHCKALTCCMVLNIRGRWWKLRSYSPMWFVEPIIQ